MDIFFLLHDLHSLVPFEDYFNRREEISVAQIKHNSTIELKWVQTIAV